MRPVLEHWLLRCRRTWRGSLVSTVLAPLLTLGALGLGLGALVDGGGGAPGGVPYVEFVAPAVVVSTAFLVAVELSTYDVMGAVRWTRQYEAMLATTLRVRDVLGGHLAYILLRVLLSATVSLAVAVALGAAGSPGAVLAVPVALLTGAAVASPVVAFAALQEQDSGFALLQRFVVVPMTLFAGVFFAVSSLPGWLQPVVWVTPLWHGVDLARGLWSGGGGGGLLGVVHVVHLAAWAAVGLVLAHRSLRRRLAS